MFCAHKFPPATPGICDAFSFFQFDHMFLRSLLTWCAQARFCPLPHRKNKQTNKWRKMLLTSCATREAILTQPVVKFPQITRIIAFSVKAVLHHKRKRKNFHDQVQVFHSSPPGRKKYRMQEAKRGWSKGLELTWSGLQVLRAACE